MEIVNHRRKILYAMENNAEGNEKCRREMQKGKAALKKKDRRSKNKESNLFFAFSKLLP